MSSTRNMLAITVVLGGLLTACGGGTSSAGTDGPEASPPTSAPVHDSAPAPGTAAMHGADTTDLSFTLIDAPNGTFGYDILRGGQLLIHQTNIPGQPGNAGCRTREDAEKLAAFVIGKIRKGEMPPTVSGEELKGLGILP